MSVKSDCLKAGTHAKGLNGRVWDTGVVLLARGNGKLCQEPTKCVLMIGLAHQLQLGRLLKYRR